MKRLSKLLIAGVIAVPAMAWAQSATQNITLNASVAKYCNFTSISGFTNSVNAVGVPTLGISTVAITNGTNANGIMNDFAFTYSANATCNTPSNFHLTSLGNGLKNVTPTPVSSGGFLSVINYQASGKWNGGTTSQLTTTGAAGPLNSLDRPLATAASGQVVVDVSASLNTSAPLLAGTYTDTLRLTLTPQ
jgi:hypothetical protein